MAPLDAILGILAAARAITARSILGVTYIRKAERDALQAGLGGLEGVEVAEYLRIAFAAPTPPAPDTVPPSDVTGLTATLDGSVPVIDSDQATDNVDVEGYITERSVDGGAWEQIATSSTTQQRDEEAALMFGSSIVYRRKAVDTSANRSANWSASTSAVVIPSDDDADVTAPNVPSAPTLVDNDTTSIELAITAVTDQTVSGDITSGVRRYLVRRDGEFRDYVPHPTGALAALESVLIGTTTTTGSYGEASGTHTLSVAGGVWYGTADSLRLVSSPVQGDFTIIGRIPSVTGQRWAKAAVTVRDGLGESARYIAAILFPADGYIVEYRTGQGSQSQQTALTAGTAPRWFKIQRKENRFLVSVSSVGSPWTLVTTITSDMGEIIEAGIAVSSDGSATLTEAEFDNVSITAATAATYYDVGVQDTAYVYDVAAEDVAGNVSSYGADTTVTMDAELPVSTFHLFPRIGSCVQGSTQDYQSSFWATLAKHDLLVMGGDWELWDETYGSGQRHAIYAGIKALNPSIKLFQYVLWDTYRVSQARYPTYDAAILANNWPLYTNGTSGSIVNNFFNGNGDHKQVNPTDAVPADSNGDRPCARFGKYAVAQFLSGTTGNGTTLADGLFFDNILQRPRSNGDFNRDGSTDSQTDSTVITAWRKNLPSLRTAAQGVNPDLICIGNCSDMWNAGGTLGSLGVLNGAFQGSAAEYALGTAGVAYGEWGGFEVGLKSYQLQIAASDEPKIVLFMHHNVDTNGKDTASPSLPNFQKMRYGLAMCLMDNGYYAAQRTDSFSYQQTNWFDEYWGGTINTRGYLGAAVDAAATYGSPWSNGVYRRRYENGWVLCNPKGNGARTVSLGATMRKLNGTQAPSVNTGALVTQVTLQDEDGLILVDPAVYG